MGRRKKNGAKRTTDVSQPVGTILCNQHAKVKVEGAAEVAKSLNEPETTTSLVNDSRQTSDAAKVNNSDSDTNSELYEECNTEYHTSEVTNGLALLSSKMKELDPDTLSKQVDTMRYIQLNWNKLRNTNSESSNNVASEEISKYKLDKKEFSTKIERLETENAKLKEHNNTLVCERNTAELEKKGLYTKLEQLERENTKIKEQVHSLKRSEAELKMFKQRLMEKVSTLKEEGQKHENEAKAYQNHVQEQIKSLQGTIKSLKDTNEIYINKDVKNRTVIGLLEKDKQHYEEQNDKLTTRVSELMSQKMGKDESDLENINFKNRPLKLVDEYDLFCSNAWLQAKTALDDLVKFSEKEKHDLLVDILKEACDFAKLAILEQKERILDSLDEPFTSLGCTSLHVSKHAQQVINSHQSSMVSQDEKNASSKEILPDDMAGAVTKYLKLNADNINCKVIAKRVLKKISEKPNYKKMFHMCDTLINSTDLIQYALESCKLAWPMNVQTPPMCFKMFEGDNDSFDDDEHEPQFGSADPEESGAVILYYVYPSLYHGDKIMKKSKVFLATYSDSNELD